MPRYQCLRCRTSYYSASSSEYMVVHACESCGSMQFRKVKSPFLAGIATDLELDTTERAIERGEHASLPYRDEQHFLQVAVPFVLEGIADCGTVICVLDLTLDFKLRERLPVDMRSSVLSIPAAEQYGPQFDPDRTIRRYRSTLANVGGPSWLIGGMDRSSAKHLTPEVLQSFEIEAHELLEDFDTTALCVYDMNLCEDAILGVMRQTHPIVAGEYGFISNPAYTGPAVAA